MAVRGWILRWLGLALAAPWVLVPTSVPARAADRLEPELLPRPRPIVGAELAAMERLGAEAARIRELPLRSRPPWFSRTPGEVYSYFTRQFNAAGLEREARLGARLYHAFGFWGPGFDLVKVQLGAHSSAVGAFYVPEDQAFTVVPRGRRALSAFARIERDAQVVHEYVHALQDQNLDMARLGLFSGNDRGKAARALIEGDAVVVMSLFASGASRAKSDEERRQLLARQLLLRRAGMAQIPSMPAMRKVPRVLTAAMVFPYVEGSAFVERAWRLGGWAEVDRCYRLPPVSSEQIMHPEKYFRGDPTEPIEDPVEIVLPELPDGLLPGARLIDADSLGELDIGVLLSETVGRAKGRAAAAGWGGDRYAAYERRVESGDGPLVICWLSVWDRPADAEEFFAAYAAVLDGKCRVPGRRLDRDGRLLDWRGPGAERTARLELWGGAVLSVEGADATETAALADLMWRARRNVPAPRFRRRQVPK
jgi:hypothetical protein